MIDISSVESRYLGSLSTGRENVPWLGGDTVIIALGVTAALDRIIASRIIAPDPRQPMEVRKRL